MPQTIEVNLVDVLNRLETKIDKLSGEIQQTKGEIQQTKEELRKEIQHTKEELREEIQHTKEELSGNINSLQLDIVDLKTQTEQTNKRLEDNSNKIAETNSRLNAMMLGFLGIVGILVTGLLGIIGKLVFFPNI